MPDGEYGLEFGIYDAPAAGTLHFEQQLIVNVVGGLYNVLLSDNGPWVLKEAFDDPNRFLQIRIVTSPGGAYDDLTLEPRQQIASVPFAFRAESGSIPQGAIILWDQSDECPAGYAEAAEFQNLTIRGADSGGSAAGIPDQPGRTCDAAQQDTGCDAASAESYDDVLSVEELAAHDHLGWGETYAGQWEFGESATTGHFGNLDVDYDNYYYKTSPTGGDQPHYHPFRTVLFCRKL